MIPDAGLNAIPPKTESSELFLNYYPELVVWIEMEGEKCIAETWNGIMDTTLMNW